MVFLLIIMGWLSCSYALGSSIRICNRLYSLFRSCVSMSCEKRNSDWYMRCANCLTRTSGKLYGRVREYFHSEGSMGTRLNFFCRKRYSLYNRFCSSVNDCLSFSNPVCPSNIAVSWNKLLRCLRRKVRGVCMASSSKGRLLILNPKFLVSDK